MIFDSDNNISQCCDINDDRRTENFYPQNFFNKVDRKKTEIDSLKTKATLRQEQDTIISNIYNDDKENELGKKLGRKRKNSKSKGLHNKYSGDNIFMKKKSTLLSELTNYINTVIYKTYNGDISQGILKKELKKMDQTQIKNVKDNKELLNKKLKDIFSVDISGRYSNFLYGHNRDLINELLNDKNEEKRMKFVKIFNLTFMDCLNHFSGKIFIKDIDGLKTLNEECKKYQDDLEYVNLFKAYIYDFEDIIMRKRSRNRKSNENNS